MQNAIEQTERPSVPEESNKALSHVDKFLHELPEDMQELFVALRHSEEILQAKDIVNGLSGQDNSKHIRLRKGVAGYLFEVLSYQYLSEQLAEKNKILLSPSETLKIYQQLYPTRRKTVNRFGLQKSIEGITVPDGIVLDFSSRKNQTVNTVAACEYSLSNPRDAFDERIIKDYTSLFATDIHQITGPTTDQSKGITDYIRSRYPQFSSNARYNNADVKLFIVAPVGIKLPFIVPEITEIPLPVPTFVFRHFVDAFMLDTQIKSSLR